MAVIDLKGYKVSYMEAGGGVPVVLVPGFTETKDIFRRQLLGLSPKYKVIACDVRPPSRGAEYSLSSLADDLADFLTALNIDAAVVCGHSFGGMIAQELAMSHTDRVSALILISSFPTLPPGAPDKLHSWFTPGRQTGHSPLSWVRGLFGGKSESDLSDTLSARDSPASRAAVEARLGLAQSTDLTPRLSEIGAPTLVLVGEKDRREIQHAAQALYEGVTDSALEVIEGGDHFCFHTRHDLVNAAIDDFLTARMASIT